MGFKSNQEFQNYLSEKNIDINDLKKKFIIEVKPEYQCKQPNKTPKKRTRKWYQEVKTWGINNAKWKSAIDWCENRGMEFKILTEKHLNPQYK